MAVSRIDPAPADAPLDWPRPAMVMLVLALALIALRPILADGLVRLPENAILPWDVYFQAIFDFVREDLGLIHLTRAISDGLEVVLDTTANLLYGRRRWPFLGPIPWTAFAAVAAVLGYWLGGWRLSLLAGATFVWTALIGQWEIAMETLSVIVVAVPVSVLLGVALGLWAWAVPAVDRALRPLLAVLQTLPFFTYLLPAVIFFKVGPTAAAVATILYAMPPMVLMTVLGLRKVPGDVVEAGQMGGAGRWQLIFRVYLPAARQEILVGVNQVIMLSLAMVVLTAFIGMPGLGAQLLSLMSSFRLGRSFEIGITIVLIAITLDRLSKAWVHKQPVHFEKNTPWWQRHQLLLLALALFAGFTALAQVMPLAAEIGRRQSLSIGRELDDAIKWFLAIDIVQAVTGWLRAFLTTQVLIPFRDTLLWLPTPAVILLVAAAGHAVGGRRTALTVGAFFTIIALSGWWDRSMITLYTVLAAVALAALIGFPLGIFAARNPTRARRVLIGCDTAQTFPSFVYLIPAIMLFGVNDVAVVFSILIFATVPLTRYTIEGLTAVPAELTEAADMSGTTRWQKLWNVQLPVALPTLAVGVNQAIMFSFFMVIVAAFIGTQDLGQELQRTLAGGYLGKNFVLGMNVALMALSFDQIISRWAATRRARLGL
jgi:glycine betaine/proline transport system permease protein